MTAAQIHVWSGFDDPGCSPETWGDLLERSPTQVLSMTWHWHKAFAETRDRGELLLLAAEKEGRSIALAPLYHDWGMVMILGAGVSDTLDFLGDVRDLETLTALLRFAQEATPDFWGFRFYMLPEHSPTIASLMKAAQMLNMELYEKTRFPTVELSFQGRDREIRKSLNGSMKKCENRLRRQGEVRVEEYHRYSEMQPFLETFFEQHRRRWSTPDGPSFYDQPDKRAFLLRFLELSACAGWCRFRRFVLEETSLGFDISWVYRGAVYLGPWSFDASWAKFSPGQTMLRHLVMKALDDGMTRIDFGGGDQPYKLRLPARTTNTLVIEMIPRS